MISAEPLTIVAQPDQALEASLFWAFQVMLNADNFGISSQNVDDVVANLDDQPRGVQRLFAEDGATADMAAKLGIPQDWAYQVIKQVGAYSEVFDRHLGAGTPFNIDRLATQNASSFDGGLMYAYPIR